jgi:regulation of enolase protein 1 (concanavalin A-like superfamily)
VTGLAFTAKRSDYFAIRWDESPYANGYRVQRSNNGSDFDTVATLPAGTTTYADAFVQPLREYYYRVVAVNDSAQGLPGEAVFAASPATAAQALPDGWAQRDVGPVGGSGATGYAPATGTFTVIAAGEDIVDATDAFHFTYRSVTGDTEITARVATQEYTDEWAKAGVMIRDGLGSGARHATIVVSPDHGTTFQYRDSAGAGSKKVNTEGTYAPYWVRLVRRGDTLTGYRSADGVTWTEEGHATVAMNETVYVGLAVTPAVKDRMATVTFTDVTVVNRPPTVVIRPQPSSVTVRGQTVDLFAQGDDDCGESNLRYDWAAVRKPPGAPAPVFSAGNTNAAQHVTARFFRAGAYVLRVRITDEGGLSVTSTVTVQVVATPAALRVTPAGQSVVAGSTLRYAVQVLDQFDQPIASPTPVSWHATKGWIDFNGVYTAPRTPGQYLVGAQVGTLSANVPVTVLAPDRRTPARAGYIPS